MERRQIAQSEQLGHCLGPTGQELRQLVLERGHGLGAARGVRRQRGRHHRVEPGRYLRALDPQRRQRSHLLIQHRVAGGGAKRRAADQHLVDERAERIDVGARVGRSAQHLLRRHVLRRPHRHPRVGEARGLGRHVAGDAEVEHLHEVRLAVARDQEDVLGLEIAVNDAAPVRGPERATDLDRDAHHPRRVELSLVGQDVREVHALEVLHDEVRASVLGRAEVGHVDDVGVPDARGGAGLASKPLHELLVSGVLTPEDLHRDALSDLDVLGPVHGAHAAGADAVADPVAVLDDPADEGLPHAGRGAGGGPALGLARGVRVRLVFLCVGAWPRSRPWPVRATPAAGPPHLGVGAGAIARRAPPRPRDVPNPQRGGVQGLGARLRDARDHGVPGLHGRRGHHLGRRARRLGHRPRGRRTARGHRGAGGRGRRLRAEGRRGERQNVGGGRQGPLRILAAPAREHRRQEVLSLGLLIDAHLVIEALHELGYPLGVGARRDAGHHLRQRAAHLLGRLEPLHAIAGERLQDEGVELGRDPGGLRRRRHGLRVPHQREGRHGIEAGQLEVGLAGQELPQDDPQAVDVGAPIGDLAAPLLGREVGGPPEDDPGRGVLLLDGAAGQPEVGQLHLAVIAEQDVGGRDVAVNEAEVAVAVHVGERAGGLPHHLQGDVERDARAGAHAAVPDLAQILALDQLHRDVEVAGDVPRIEGRHQVGVRQAEDHLGLVEEAVDLRLIGLLGDDLLDHAELAETAALIGGREVDLPHPAAGQRLQEDVLAEQAREAFRHGPAGS